MRQDEFEPVGIAIGVCKNIRPYFFCTHVLPILHFFFIDGRLPVKFSDINVINFMFDQIS